MSRGAGAWIVPLLAFAAGCVASVASAPPLPRSATAADRGPCSDFEHDIERVWSTTRKAEVTAAFVKLGVEYADRVVERVTTKMDALTTSWVMMSERLCKDYVVRKLITQREYAARSICLDSALVYQTTFAQMLAAPGKSTPANALAGFEAISNRLDACQSQGSLVADDAALPAKDQREFDALTSEATLAATLGDGARAARAANQAVALADASGNERAQLESGLAQALVDIRTSRYAAAQRELEQATARAARLGAQLSLALAYQYTGQLQLELHRNEQAVASFEQALALRRTILPPDDPQIAWTLDNLGAAYHARGDDRRAIALHEQALSLYRRRPTPLEPAIADALSNLGLAWAGLGEHARAIAYYEESLAIGQPTAHDDRPAVADTFNNIGLSYRERGDFARAVASFTRAIAIYRSAYSGTAPALRGGASFGEQPVHPHLARALYGLGSTYLRAGDYARAATVLEQSVESLEPNDPIVAAAHNDLGFALGEHRQYERSVGEFERALSLRIQTPGTPDAELADSQANLGIALMRVGRSRQAIDRLQGALDLYRRTLGAADPHVFAILEQLGLAYQQLGDCARAKSTLEQALALCTATVGHDDPRAQHLASAFASASEVCGRP